MKLLSKRVVRILFKKRVKISVAESCTGGLLSHSITSISGSSKVFKLGIVSYSNDSKAEVLKVRKKIILKYGAVSEEVCKEMAKNIGSLGRTKISVSITGIAGPGGGSNKKPVGLVYIGLKKGNKINVKKHLFKNKGRAYIQKSAVKECLKQILLALK